MTAAPPWSSSTTASSTASTSSRAHPRRRDAQGCLRRGQALHASSQEAAKKLGKVVVGTVKGDIHDIEDIVVFTARRQRLRGPRPRHRRQSRQLDKIVESAPGRRPLGFLTLAFDSMKETVGAITQAGLATRSRSWWAAAPSTSRSASTPAPMPSAPTRPWPPSPWPRAGCRLPGHAETAQKRRCRIAVNSRREASRNQPTVDDAIAL